MADADFQQWVDLLEARTGITLQANRKSFLLTSLSVRMREQGIDGYQAYFDFLLSGAAGKVEWEILVDRLTVHETRFYRDENALSVVRDVFLPACLAGHDQDQPVKLHYWSVGCASGEEPYTLAMLSEDFFQHRQQRYQLGITASDISTDALGIARRAVYPANRMTTTPVHWRHQYFTPTENGKYRVNDAIRRLICFTRINLLEVAQSPVGMMDLIYCQNVLIYFKREMRHAVLANLVERLKPGGMLILGAGEVVDWKHPDLESLAYKGTLVFRRRIETKGSRL
ncbi:MAG: protein-glutamate O-methyltransferase CheR [Gammaproteobacteria bacterium]